MIGALAILGELDSRIAGHQQLHTEEGYSNSRNAIIIALKDLREWVMQELEKDMADFENRETAKKDQKEKDPLPLIQVPAGQPCDCESCSWLLSHPQCNSNLLGE